MAGTGRNPEASGGATGAPEDKTAGPAFHSRFDTLNEPAETRIVRYFEQSELLNRLQPLEVRLRRVGRNYLHMKKVYARD